MKTKREIPDLGPDWGKGPGPDVSGMFDVILLRRRVEALETALREIADPTHPGNASMCECEHDTDDCCALSDYYCPQCIAGRALSSTGTDTGHGGSH